MTVNRTVIYTVNCDDCETLILDAGGEVSTRAHAMENVRLAEAVRFADGTIRCAECRAIKGSRKQEVADAKHG